MKKKICVITGSRAEYGLFYPLLKEIEKVPAFCLEIIVTGTHLSSEYGLTYKEILRDGFKINEKLKLPLNDDSPEGITRSLGLAVVGLGAALKRRRPDMVVLLGDRFETFAAAIAAFVAKIPIAHLHGGEISQGALDDSFRHSITKMSLLHFTSTEAYKRRVIQLGENPHRVFNVGALGIDNVKRTKFLTKEVLEKELKFSLDGKIVLVTFHPVTLEHNTSRDHFSQILAALDQRHDLKVIFTMPNADIYGKIIIQLINKYVKKSQGQAIAFKSLGRIKYLSLLKHIDLMLGNSSSGIIEMPSLGKPTINVGDRQKGRIAAGSVIQCPPARKIILKVLDKAFSKDFRQKCSAIKNPYDRGLTAKSVVSILKKEIPRIKSLKKEFYNLK